MPKLIFNFDSVGIVIFSTHVDLRINARNVVK